MPDDKFDEKVRELSYKALETLMTDLSDAIKRCRALPEGTHLDYNESPAYIVSSMQRFAQYC